MSECHWRMADLLPHVGPAVLLDEVLACTEHGLSAAVTIREASAFRQEDGVPAHVGLEYMAQACGAYSGVSARRAGKPPNRGFILGTRRFHAARAWFVDGMRLEVSADLVYRDDEVGVFDCAISSGGDVLATAQLIVAEAKDAAAVFSRQGGEHDG
jgi:predicted hotdog family 3-hydroxylacyl-ACP dehydratase